MPIEKSLDELASILGGRVAGDGSRVIKDVAPLEDAGPGDIAFIGDRKHLKLLKTTNAGAVVVREGEYGDARASLILVKNPQRSFAMLMDIFRPCAPPAAGVHPPAFVHPGARLGAGVSAGPFSVIEDGAAVGARTALYPGVYIGKNATVGEDCVLYPGVCVREGCVIGDRVVIHCNSVVGSDGFGYAREGARYHKIPQRGIVRIGDDVELGACVTVDRATLGETVIGRGTKVDNLVQIAHNVKIGEDAVIVAQAGIAGSSRVGDRVQLGGQAGVAGHIEIGDDAMIGAKSGVIGDIPGKNAFSGMPAMPHGDWLRAESVFAKLPEMKKKLAELEKRLKAIEEK